MDNNQQETKTRIAQKEVAQLDLDFDAIKEWRKPGADELPVCSILTFYEACGMTQIIRDYMERHPGTQIAALDTLTCNFYTLQRIKNFVTDIWQRYSLTINEDNHVKWDTHHYAKGVAHKPRKLKATIRNSLNFDFVNYCPSIDDELPDNILVFTAYVKEPIEDEVVDEVPNVRDAGEVVDAGEIVEDNK